MNEAQRFITESHGKDIAEEIHRRNIRTDIDSVTGETSARFDDGSRLRLDLKDAVRLDELKSKGS